MNELVDQAARDRIRTGLNESLWVEAAAGTGKTHELVQRLVNLLGQGVPVQNIVAVTFTRKAAGELKLRLRQALEEARRDPGRTPTHPALNQALLQLEDARVGTIHSFCAEMLHERPVQAGIDPNFVELDEGEARRLYDRVFRRFIQQRLAEPSATLGRALARPPGFDNRGPLARLADAGWELVRWRDFDAPWQTDTLDLGAHLEHFADRVIELSDLSEQRSRDDDDLYRALAPAREWVGWLQRAELDGGRTEPAMEARLLGLLPQLKRAKPKKFGMYAEGLSRLDLLETRDKLLLDLEAFKRRADAQLAVGLRQELSEVVTAYEAYKHRLGALDFEDLLLVVRDLLRDDPEVRAYLQARFTHLLVDEFQDTDPLQTEILLLLSADDPAESDWHLVRPRPGSLFLVGDPKQSIYRFRRADVLQYQRVRSQLAAQGVARVQLSHSFRATAQIQDAINLAFSPHMSKGGDGQPSYVPLQGGPPAPPEQPALLAVPVPYPHGRYGVTGFAVAQDLPRALGGFLQWLLQDSGWTVRRPGGSGEREPVAAHHVALLFRRLSSGAKDLTRPYVAQLEQRDIPHLLVGSRSFQAREEIDALVAACSAIEWPEDELSVLATLRGPLLAIADDLLLRYRQHAKSLHPLSPRPNGLPADLNCVREALDLLQTLWASRNSRPLPTTVNHLLAATRAHASFGLRPAGDQVLANVQRVVDMARGFEMQGGLSFRGFVERLIEETQRPRSHESPTFEEDAPGVRLMTVHSAKGLEFPIVVLADIGSGNRAVNPGRSLHADKRRVGLRLMDCSPRELLDQLDTERQLEEEEAVRLAYVAATRARDLLVLPGVGEGTSGLFAKNDPRTSWTAPLEKVFYPPVQRYRRPDPAPGVPIVHHQTVLGLPDNQQRNKACIAPGQHVGRAGGPPVVWMDPTQLKPSAPLHSGLVHERYLAKDEAGAAEASLSAYQAWRSQHIEVTEAGQTSAVDLISASETDLGPEGFSGFVEPVLIAKDPARPKGARFGTLVHAILRDVDFEAEAASIEDLSAMHGRLLGATPQEVEAAVGPVQSALQHDLLQRARRASRRHREYPVLFDTDEGQRVDGSIDLTFLEDGAWVVVDFKTDADPQEHRAQHLRQMQWYMTALSGLMGTEVLGYLLYV